MKPDSRSKRWHRRSKASGGISCSVAISVSRHDDVSSSLVSGSVRLSSTSVDSVRPSNLRRYCSCTNRTTVCVSTSSRSCPLGVSAQTPRVELVIKPYFFKYVRAHANLYPSSVCLLFPGCGCSITARGGCRSLMTCSRSSTVDALPPSLRRATSVGFMSWS